MKRITVLLIAFIACLLTISAKSDNSSDSTQVGGTTNQIEYTDTPADNNQSLKREKKHANFFDDDFQFNSGLLIPIVAIICVFGLPAIIVFLSFYFGYKKRKAKYQLVEKALEAGQPIPEEIIRASKNDSNSLNKGITNTFTGIGLFIFLWAITTEFSIGSIGLLVMFMGLGQIVIHYAQERKTGKQESRKEKDDQSPTTTE